MTWRWKHWLRDILLIILIFAAVQWWRSRDLPSGITAPSLAGPSLEGQPMALSNYRGKPVLVHFWATWCPICRLQDGGVASIAQRYPVISVATTSGSAGEIQTYLESEGLDMPVMLDESGDLARRWGVRGVPTSFVIDSQGNIDYATTGYSTELGLRLRLALAN